MAASARLQKPKAKKIYVATHAINLRSRTEPPHLLDNVSGNCVLSAVAYHRPSPSHRGDLHLHELVERLRKSIRMVRGSYITNGMSMSKESYTKDQVKFGFLGVMGKLECCFFTSWIGFPVYELDFGWGKPVRFATTSMPLKNLIILVSSKSGDDIEASLHDTCRFRNS